MDDPPVVVLEAPSVPTPVVVIDPPTMIIGPPTLIVGPPTSDESSTSSSDSSDSPSTGSSASAGLPPPDIPQLILTQVDQNTTGGQPLSQRASVRQEYFKMSPRERESVLLSPREAQPPVQSIKNLPEMRTQGVCEALYDYQSSSNSATGMQIFSFKKGDIFFLLPSSSPVWRRVRDFEGLAGYVPGDSIRIVHEDRIQELKILLSPPELQQHNMLYQKQEAKLAAEAIAIATVDVDFAPRKTSTPPSKPSKSESATLKKLEKASKSESASLKKMEKLQKSDGATKTDKKASKRGTFLSNSSSSSSSSSSSRDGAPAPKNMKKSDGGEPTGLKKVSPRKKDKTDTYQDKKKKKFGCFG